MDSRQATPAAAVVVRRPILQRLGIVVVVSIATVALLDVSLRLWWNSPVYQMAWPEIPELSRYAPNSERDEIKIGDLGGLTSSVADDEPREVRTTIDAFGFRNDAAATKAVLDLIVLGDSVGFGVGTTQDKTFPSLLRDRHQLEIYNLSLPYTGPWPQFVNLSLESQHLHVRPGAVVLWTIFGGNDLEDRYGTLDVGQIQRRGLAGRAWTAFTRVRSRSPIYQMLRRIRYAVAGALPPGPSMWCR